MMTSTTRPVGLGSAIGPRSGCCSASAKRRSPTRNCSKVGCEIRWRLSERRHQLVALLGTRCRELSIEPPVDDRIDRIVRAAIHAHDERFCAGVLSRLAPPTRERLEALLRPAANESSNPPSDQSTGTAPALLLRLRGDPGKPDPRRGKSEVSNRRNTSKDRAPG